MRSSVSLGVLTITTTGLLVGFAALLDAPAADASSAPKPKIVSITASPHSLPAAGGIVTLAIRTRGALSCSVSGQPGPFQAQGRARTVSCRNGRGRISTYVASNRYPMPVPIHFEVSIVAPANRRLYEQISVPEAAAAPAGGGGTGAGSSGAGGFGDPLTTDDTPLPPATVGVAFDGVLVAGGGTPPYSWAVTGGALPAGLVLSAGGEITGTPAAAGSYQLTVQVTDSAGASATEDIRLSVSDSQSSQPIGGQTSSNWAGYVLPSTNSVFTEAGGRWTVPSLDCAATPNADLSIWVGIGGQTWPDGTSSGTLLQTGTEDHCVNGVQIDNGFTEEYPSDPNRSVPFNEFPVTPGNTIQATVYQSTTGAWATRVDNVSTGWSGVLVTGLGWGVLPDSGGGSFALQGTAAGLTYSGGYSAEWIVEDSTDADAGNLMPFARFATVSFSGLTTSLSPWTLDSSDEVTLIDAAGTPMATPSAPTGDGFTVSDTG